MSLFEPRNIPSNAFIEAHLGAVPQNFGSPSRVGSEDVHVARAWPRKNTLQIVTATNLHDGSRDLADRDHSATRNIHPLPDEVVAVAC